MCEIIEKIEIKKKTTVGVRKFLNDDIYPSVNTHYFCFCKQKNKICISPFVNNSSLSSLHDKGILEKENILKEGLAKIHSPTKKNLGLFLVNDLPTYYSFIKCNKCEQKYIVVYGIGEQQPSKEICIISGVWNYVKI